MNLVRLFHTARHLKPVQVYARLRRRLVRPRVSSTPAPGRRAQSSPFVAPPPRPRSFDPGPQPRFTFLNRSAALPDATAWNDPGMPKLWLYNLHYFDDLLAPADAAHAAAQRALVSRWIAENPPGMGNGWEPYPLSLRIVTWIKWILAGASPDREMLDSLAGQVRWLEQDIEWHLLGNHLFANAKALVFAGLFFSGPEADRWLRRGMAILARELPEQRLPDGAHFELSPMYHALFVEDVLDLINLSRCFGAGGDAPLSGLPGALAQMRRFLLAMTHPDGQPSFFNDAAIGIAPSAAALDDYADRLGFGREALPGPGAHHFPDAGYVRVNSGDLAAILDVAKVGPDYIPGHAHADTLSFEMSVAGERVIVNGGTSTYAPGPLRSAERATRAHSTVEIGGQDSSEVWASFRVARRARPVDVSVAGSGGTISVAAAHDGYRRLPGRPVHRRRWTVSGGALTVEDVVEGGAGQGATAWFHLAPGVRAELSDDRRGGVLRLGGAGALPFRASAEIRVDPSEWHPEFGLSRPCTSLAIPLRDGRLETRFGPWAAP